MGSQLESLLLGATKNSQSKNQKSGKELYFSLSQNEMFVTIKN